MFQTTIAYLVHLGKLIHQLTKI